MDRDEFLEAWRSALSLSVPYLPEMRMEKFLDQVSSQRNAAVLIVFALEASGEWSLLLTQRSETVSQHKGEVSFPGGRLETEKETWIDAALREAEEEVRLIPDQIQVLGEMPPLSTVSSFTRVVPVLGIMKKEGLPVLVPERKEVAHTLWLPWKEVLQQYSKKMILKEVGELSLIHI